MLYPRRRARIIQLIRLESVLIPCFRFSYDLDLPLDVDDEYWFPEDPSQAFQQPPGKPSKISYFISTLKLNTILARALRTIVRETLLLEMLSYSSFVSSF